MDRKGQKVEWVKGVAKETKTTKDQLADKKEKVIEGKRVQLQLVQLVQGVQQACWVLRVTLVSMGWLTPL